MKYIKIFFKLRVLNVYVAKYGGRVLIVYKTQYGGSDGKKKKALKQVSILAPNLLFYHIIFYRHSFYAFLTSFSLIGKF